MDTKESFRAVFLQNWGIMFLGLKEKTLLLGSWKDFFFFNVLISGLFVGIKAISVL